MSLSKFMAKSGRAAPKGDGEKRVSTVAVMHDGKMLMGRRRDNGKWTTPGGHAEAGEDKHAAARRELKEEAGIDLGEDDLEHIGTERVENDKGEGIHVSAFKAELDGSRPKPDAKNDPDHEMTEWKWVDCSRGVPPWIADNLHVPLERNVLHKKLGHSADWSPALDKYQAKRSAT